MFVKNPDEIAKKIIKNRQLSGDNVYNLLRFAKNKEEIANLLGAENINKLSGRNVFHLIRETLSRPMMFGPHSFEVAKILGAENINKLSGYLVFELLRSAKDVEETAKLIGSENKIGRAHV